MMKRVIYLALLLSFGSSSAFAQDGAWKLDKAHSNVTFAVRHMLISEVTGKFKDFDIAVTSSDDNFSDGVIEASIKVASITTENERRDNHLRSDDFFNAEKFPEIRFKSTSMKKTGENSYKIYGILTIRDTTKQVVFDATHNGTLTTKQGKRMGWTATLSLNRFDYGLKWNRTIETGALVAGDKINITINAEFVK
jgi:polyisoprenoid-binding protein YceI